MKLEQFSDRPVPQSVTSSSWPGGPALPSQSLPPQPWPQCRCCGRRWWTRRGLDSDGSGAGVLEQHGPRGRPGLGFGLDGGSGGDCVSSRPGAPSVPMAPYPAWTARTRSPLGSTNTARARPSTLPKSLRSLRRRSPSYQIIILQNLNGWTFSADEKAAFEAWIRAGGGVVSLAGYSDQPTEAAPTNDLLAFSGLSYVGLSGAGDISTSPKEACSYCLGNSDAQGGWEPAHPISANITAVGALWGRSVSADAGETVATWDGKRAGATVDVDAGRVFLFHDEWVTYNSQWNGASLAQDCRTNGDQACMSAHPTLSYRIPRQLWYNTIKWLAHEPSCFDIRDMTIVK